MAKAVGVGVNDAIDVEQYPVLRPLVEAIIRHENGRLAPVTAPDIDAGIALAGIMPDRQPKPLATSKTVIGSSIATAGTAVGAVVDQVKPEDVPVSQDALEAIQASQEAVSYAMGVWEWAGIIAAVLAIVGIGIVLYSKWDRRRRGVE